MKTAVMLVVSMIVMVLSVQAQDWNYDQYRTDLGYYYAEQQYANSGFKTQLPLMCYNQGYYNNQRYYNNQCNGYGYNRYVYNRYGYNGYNNQANWYNRGGNRYIARDDLAQPVKENKFKRNEYYQKSPRYAEPVPVVSSVNKYEMETGWIKFTVVPETATVTVDTKYIGEAKKYNGYPAQYVSLIGTRKVTIKAPGYKEAIFLVGVERESRTMVECKLDLADPNTQPNPEEIPDIEGNVALRIK